MNKNFDQARLRCRTKARPLLELRKRCHIDPGHRSDGCGYFRNRYCYLLVDCRSVKGEPLCWVSIVDHYSGEVLYSSPCADTPGAAKHGRAFFSRQV